MWAVTVIQYVQYPRVSSVKYLLPGLLNYVFYQKNIQVDTTLTLTRYVHMCMLPHKKFLDYRLSIMSPPLSLTFVCLDNSALEVAIGTFNKSQFTIRRCPLHYALRHAMLPVNLVRTCFTSLLYTVTMQWNARILITASTELMLATQRDTMQRKGHHHIVIPLYMAL